MNSNKIILSVFILVALTQLYVPLKMILNVEKLLVTGIEYKFKTASIRSGSGLGNYITLRYDENMINIQNQKDWVKGETIYVLLKTDDDGFAKIKLVSKNRPTDNNNFIKAQMKQTWVKKTKKYKLTIEYPSNNYYLGESKAEKVNLFCKKSQKDTTQNIFALVSINEGEAIVKDVLFDGVSIKEILMQQGEDEE